MSRRICKPRDVSPAEWFWVRTGPTPHEREACWEWTGPLVDGYGQFFVSPGKKVYAHVFAYELLVGPVGDNDLDHLCQNRPCFRPSHLEPIGHGDNVRRAFAFRKLGDRCSAGHAITPLNITWNGVYPRCRECDLASRRARYQARKAAA